MLPNKLSNITLEIIVCGSLICERIGGLYALLCLGYWQFNGGEQLGGPRGDCLH